MSWHYSTQVQWNFKRTLHEGEPTTVIPIPRECHIYIYMSVQMCLNGGVWYVTALTNRGREWGRNVNRLSCQRHGRWWDTNSERLVKHWLVLELRHRVQHIFCVWWQGIYSVLSMSYHMLKFVANCVMKCIRGLLLVIGFLCLEGTFRLHLQGYNFLKMSSCT